MRKAVLLMCVPVDQNGKNLNFNDEDFSKMEEMLPIAQRRTHRIALHMIGNFTPLNLKQALSAAYLQGMEDTILVTTVNK